MSGNEIGRRTERKREESSCQLGAVHTWREQQFQVASWNDLREAFEAAAGRPLDDFFRQWLERTSAPQLTLQDAERTSDGKVAFILRQPPPPYRLAVPAVIETAQGLERHMVRFDTAEQRYTLEPAARATALRNLTIACSDAWTRRRWPRSSAV